MIHINSGIAGGLLEERGAQPFLQTDQDGRHSACRLGRAFYWLKSKGKGYQTHINAILREEMLKEVSSNEVNGKKSGADIDVFVTCLRSSPSQGR